MTTEQENKITAYLNGEMPANEKNAFEAEVAADPALQRELQLYQLADKVIALQGETRLRALAREARDKVGPLPDPEITFTDRIRFFFYSARNRLIAFSLFGLALLACAWFLVAISFCPLSNFPGDYFIEVKKKEVYASPNNETPQTILDYCREIYFGDAPERLEQIAREDLSKSSVANYFLAHWYLKNGNYSQAEQAFVRTLSEKEVFIRSYTEVQDFGKIKFNLLLSRLGQSRDWKTAVSELAALRADPELVANSTADVKAALLVKKLNNPGLRFLCFQW